MPVVVVYDASVLYPNTLRDLLIRIAQANLVQAKWTSRILDESSPLSNAIARTYPRRSWRESELARTRS